MAREIDKVLAETLAKYHPNPKSAVWDCHGTWVVLHKAVEVMAAKAGIKFSLPTIVEAHGEKKVVAMIVSASLGDVTDWATGEAAPANNKHVDPSAMAEKRARDRVAIKLLGLHGLYSEDEAEEFKDGRPTAPLTEDTGPTATEILSAAEKGLTVAAAKGSSALKDAWIKLSPATRDLFGEGGACPQRFKDAAAKIQQRDAA